MTAVHLAKTLPQLEFEQAWRDELMARTGAWPLAIDLDVAHEMQRPNRPWCANVFVGAPPGFGMGVALLLKDIGGVALKQWSTLTTDPTKAKVFDTARELAAYVLDRSAQLDAQYRLTGKWPLDRREEMPRGAPTPARRRW